MIIDISCATAVSVFIVNDIVVGDYVGCTCRRYVVMLIVDALVYHVVGITTVTDGCGIAVTDVCNAISHGSNTQQYHMQQRNTRP